MIIKGPILLYGAGREARSTLAFLNDVAPGENVHVVVDSGEADLPGIEQVPVESLEAAIASKDYATIVRSAGVSIYKPVLIAAKQAGIEITTNINLWARHKRGKAKTIAITGTKGKSTTAKLIHTILKQAGLDAGLGGNIGVPPLDLAPCAYAVLELSSFQTADMDFNLDFIGITSLFPEHLDWHLNEKNYFADKLNILRRKKPYQCALNPQVVEKDCLPQPPNGLVHALADLEPDFQDQLMEQVSASRLKGVHNAQNAILAARLCLGVGATQRDILQGIAAFEPLPHRLQEIQLGPKTFVNDSIATNPEATRAAIAAYPRQKVSLVLGGYDRGQKYDGLVATLKNSTLSQVWFLPDTGHRILREIGESKTPFACHKAISFEDMFTRLAADPDQFETLILSPGAPSYNQFKNFEQRGTTFLELARKHFT